MAKKVLINRAPVLTLWATVVAEHLGFDVDEALTLGKSLAGLTAQAKGQRLGIFEPSKEKPAAARERPRGVEFSVSFFGRAIPAANTEQGVRATAKGKPIDPESVRRYLKSKFGDELPEVRRAMEKLAESRSPQELAAEAFRLYERFRPSIPAGEKGWGAKGELDLDEIRSLAKG